MESEDDSMAGDDRVEKKVGCRALFGPTSVRNSIPFVLIVIVIVLALGQLKACSIDLVPYA